MAIVSLIVPPDQPPEHVRPAAHAAQDAGLEELWLWEDCFAESGIAPAAALLEATDRLRIGIGLLPVPLRSVALTAMEIATIERMYPGRLLPGIGHGVLPWMGQVGARVDSPLTLLREHGLALRALLAGERLTEHGCYVHLEDVQLRWPPAATPPVLVGAVGPKTLELAGQVGDGVILTAESDDVPGAVQTVRSAWEAAGRAGEPDIVAFADAPAGASVGQLTDRVAPLVAAGATRVPMVAISPEGPPDGSRAIFTFAERVGEVARAIASRAIG